MKKVAFFSFFIFSTFLFGQDKVPIENASFEGQPGMEVTPSGWFGCEKGTTPDILPGPWQVRTRAAKGATYLGLISREDGTRESVGQKLKIPLRGGNCFVIKMDVARSSSYVTYNRPIKLRIWGGGVACEKKQLLAESKIIRNTTWTTFEFEFDVKEDIRFIILEAWYDEGGQFRRGNILIDNIRPITKCIRA